jgi:hypothetical protein
MDRSHGQVSRSKQAATWQPKEPEPLQLGVVSRLAQQLSDLVQVSGILAFEQLGEPRLIPKPFKSERAILAMKATH